MAKTKKVGFAALSKAKRSEIAARGGKTRAANAAKNKRAAARAAKKTK